MRWSSPAALSGAWPLLTLVQLARDTALPPIPQVNTSACIREENHCRELSLLAIPDASEVITVISRRIRCSLISSGMNRAASHVAHSKGETLRRK